MCLRFLMQQVSACLSIMLVNFPCAVEVWYGSWQHLVVPIRQLMQFALAGQRQLFCCFSDFAAHTFFIECLCRIITLMRKVGIAGSTVAQQILLLSVSTFGAGKFYSCDCGIDFLVLIVYICCICCCGSQLPYNATIVQNQEWENSWQMSSGWAPRCFEQYSEIGVNQIFNHLYWQFMPCISFRPDCWMVQCFLLRASSNLWSTAELHKVSRINVLSRAASTSGMHFILLLLRYVVTSSCLGSLSGERQLCLCPTGN